MTQKLANMDNTQLSKYTISFGLALAMAAVVDALLVVAKEKIPAVLSILQKMTGHHWISHVSIVLGLFATCGWLLAQGKLPKLMTPDRLSGILVAGVVVGSLLIAGFYLMAGD